MHSEARKEKKDSKEGTGVRPLNPRSVSGQLSRSDTRTGWGQVVCAQEAEVLGFCTLKTALPLQEHQAKDPGAQAWFLVCPAELLPLVPARTSPGRTLCPSPSSPLLPSNPDTNSLQSLSPFTPACLLLNWSPKHSQMLPLQRNQHVEHQTG